MSASPSAHLVGGHTTDIMRSRRRDTAWVVAVFATAAGACAPAASFAQSGGTAPQSPLPQTVAPTGSALYGPPGTPSLVPPIVGYVNRNVLMRGTLPGDSGRRVVLQQIDTKTGAWKNVASAKVRSTDRYLIRWRPRKLGPAKLRAVLQRKDGRVHATRTAPTTSMNIFRAALATYYGPGFYGKQTACGQELTPLTLGVAHKTHPCGTLVAVNFNGRSVVVPVIDRGPFVSGVTWDLTEMTAYLLGFDGKQTIGVLTAAPGTPQTTVAPAPAPPAAAESGGATTRG